MLSAGSPVTRGRGSPGQEHRCWSPSRGGKLCCTAVQLFQRFATLEAHSTANMNIRISIILSVALFALATEAGGADAVSIRAVVDQFCVKCHDADANKGGLDLAN